MFEKLFEPIEIGNVKLKNRLIVPPMVTNFCDEDGRVTERFIRHHEEKAKGGWGLITIEQTVVTQAGKGHPRQPVLSDDLCLEGLRELTRRVHDAGAKISVQINHAGRSTNRSITGHPLVAPSPLRDPLRADVPEELTVDQIHETVEQFGVAAERAKRAGFDMITEHAHARYLIATFLSPSANKRTDEYGGSLANRARFAVEVLKSMRRGAGPDLPIIFRFSADEYMEGGLVVEDTLAIARIMEDAGADLIDVSAGNAFTYYYITPPAIVPHAFASRTAALFKKAVSKPVAIAGRINDPFIAETILKMGNADLISMGRASIADPYFPEKIRGGRLDEVRYCIGCLQGCVDGVRELRPISCLVNPGIGAGETDICPATVKKKIAVVGGGPAGMTAAITAAERGHDVTLFEKEGRLGGQWLCAGVPPGKSECNTFTFWLKNRLKQQNVTVRRNSAADINALKRGGFDSIIVATGAVPIVPEIAGIKMPNVVQAVDVLSGKADKGKIAVIIGGGSVGAETALHLAVLGMKVHIIEMMGEIAEGNNPSCNHFLFEALKNRGVECHVLSVVKEIKANSVVFEKDTELIEITGVDMVVSAAGTKPVNPFSGESDLTGANITIIGDAKTPRRAIDAVREGYEAALNL